MNNLVLNVALNAFTKKELFEVFFEVVNRKEIVDYLSKINKSDDFEAVERLERIVRQKSKPKNTAKKLQYKECHSCRIGLCSDNIGHTNPDKRIAFCVKCQVEQVLQEDLH